VSESTVTLTDPDIALQLFGPHDSNLKMVRDQLGVTITHRSGQIKIAGPAEAVRMATEVVEKLRDRACRSGQVSADDVVDALGKSPGDASPGNLDKPELAVGNPVRRIKPRTEGQGRYVEAIRKHDMTFCIGPAGCGKTFLAVAAAVEALKGRQVRKIVLVRPAVEAGESLGYLPGDLQAKLNPYLRPLLDAIHEMIDYDQAKYLMEQETIEVIPLAYMRGRTLNKAFIILDEAQNTTIAQMKMFLTRMGEGSKMVVSGDISQVDLPAGVSSGLRDAVQRLQGIRGIGFSRLGESDIVRHALVQQIVMAYDATGHASAGITFKPNDV
jgi:phosphate starvation-inducible PhoH-like protein